MKRWYLIAQLEKSGCYFDLSFKSMKKDPQTLFPVVTDLLMCNSYYITHLLE